MFLHKKQMDPQQSERQQREHHNVQGVEASQRVARDVLAAAGQQQQVMANHGHDAHNRGPNAGGKKRQFVPRQQISAEAEGHEQPQQQHAGQPGHLPRPPVRAHQIRRQQVQEQDADQQIRAPGMGRANQPSEVDFRHNRLHALERLIRRRLVVEGEQDPRHDLNHEQEQRHSAEIIEMGGAVDRHPFLACQPLQVFKTQPLLQKAVQSAKSVHETRSSSLAGDNNLLFPHITSKCHLDTSPRDAAADRRRFCHSSRKRLHGNCRKYPPGPAGTSRCNPRGCRGH